MQHVSRITSQVDRTYARPEQIGGNDCQDCQAKDRVLAALRCGEEQVVPVDPNKHKGGEPCPAPPAQQAGSKDRACKRSCQQDPARETCKHRGWNNQGAYPRNESADVEQQSEDDHAARRRRPHGDEMFRGMRRSRARLRRLVSAQSRSRQPARSTDRLPIRQAPNRP